MIGLKCTLWQSVSCFYLASSVSGAFGGLLAYGLVQINYKGRPGWTWVFIVEGAITVLFGLLAFFILPSSPQSASFLKPEEKKYILTRLQEDGTAAAREDGDRFSWREVRLACTSPHVILLALAKFMNGMQKFIPFHLLMAVAHTSFRNHFTWACLVSFI
jgi:MFS family permease